MAGKTLSEDQIPSTRQVSRRATIREPEPESAISVRNIRQGLRVITQSRRQCREDFRVDSRRQMTTLLWLCQPCHVVLHYVFPNEQPDMKYNSVDRIVSGPPVQNSEAAPSQRRWVMIPRLSTSTGVELRTESRPAGD
ncbi:uncharacterized protein LY79DRAFT_305765 [Colletotrichum navitas]|uniref:Uncharacterized protein n=1 Tax=Colletotrichum navitas TaxID=681940 RepID=A0AAD8V1X7_9PEZI|nr:uncharacterized protein LY79DRAFT_305765 [Colletotrichum navitas]KAK1580401.1 hypothetical protein LY79DRAFT_305765 [Colletotrichum navitas]